METVSTIILIAIIVVVFLLLREFWCWYFKINKVVSLLEQIANNTAEQKSISTGNNKYVKEFKCNGCGKPYVIDRNENRTGEFKCPDCGHLNIIY